MKTTECPSCAMDVDASAKQCPICGYEFPKSNNGLAIVAILLVILFLVMIFIF